MSFFNDTPLTRLTNALNVYKKPCTDRPPPFISGPISFGVDLASKPLVGFSRPRCHELGRRWWQGQSLQRLQLPRGERQQQTVPDLHLQRLFPRNSRGVRSYVRIQRVMPAERDDWVLREKNNSTCRVMPRQVGGKGVLWAQTVLAGGAPTKPLQCRLCSTAAVLCVALCLVLPSADRSSGCVFQAITIVFWMRYKCRYHHLRPWHNSRGR